MLRSFHMILLFTLAVGALLVPACHEPDEPDPLLASFAAHGIGPASEPWPRCPTSRTGFSRGNGRVPTACLSGKVGSKRDLRLLAIFAREQVSFLARFATGGHALSERTRREAREVFEDARQTRRDGNGEERAVRTLYARTGWMHAEGEMDHGWFVGWVEEADTGEVHVFALNMDMPGRADLALRKPVVMDALVGIGAWDRP